MIPLCAEYDVPGADDKEIFDAIVVALCPNVAVVQGLLSRFDGVRVGGATDTHLHAILSTLVQARAPALDLVITAVAYSYYSDDRVMRSLALEQRAPFPLGYTVDQGDWSLLDPVRHSKMSWRRTS